MRSLLLAILMTGVAYGAETKSLDQLLKEKQGAEAAIAALTKTFNDEKAEFDKLPATKAHQEKVAEATRKLNEDFDKSPAAAAYVKKMTDLRVKFAEASQRLQTIKDQIVEQVAKTK